MSKEIKAGCILDVYPEGERSFRACVLEISGNGNDLARVVNLKTGRSSLRGFCECELPVIADIFNLFEGEK